MATIPATLGNKGAAMQSMDRGETVRPARAGRIRMVVAIVLLVGGAAAFGVFYFSTRDVQLAPPRLIGNIWTATVAGATRVFYVTKEDRAEARSFDVDGQYTFRLTYCVYRLCSRNAIDGSHAAETRLARIDTTSVDFRKYRTYATLPDGPGILGPEADVLWLWNGGIEARTLSTLELVWTETQLREKNPAAAASLPDDPKYVKVLDGLDKLVFKSRDARYTQINRASGVFEPVNEQEMAALSREHTKTTDSAFFSVRPPGESLRSTSASGLVLDSLIDHGAWFGLLNGDDRARLQSRLGWLEEWYYRTTTLRESSNQLLRGAYELEAQPTLKRTIIQLKPDTVAPIGEERFIMAGFLRRPESQDAWVLPARQWSLEAGSLTGTPVVEAFIVLSRDTIGEKGVWQVSRVGVDGKLAWKRPTGLTEIEHVNDGHGSIVLTGFNAGDSKVTGERPGRMVFVEEASGRARALNIASGEVDASP